MRLIGLTFAIALCSCSSLVPQEKNQKDAIKGATEINASQHVAANKTAENALMPTARVDIDLPATVTVPQIAGCTNPPVRSGSVHVELGPQTYKSDGDAQSAQGTDTKQEFQQSIKQSIPLFVKLIGLCLGVVMFALIARTGISFLTTQFPALRSLIGVAHLKTNSEIESLTDSIKARQDAELSKEIAVIEAQIAACTDSTKLNELNAALARLNKLRGKLNAT